MCLLFDDNWCLLLPDVASSLLSCECEPGEVPPVRGRVLCLSCLYNISFIGSAPCAAALGAPLIPPPAKGIIVPFVGLIL